VSFATITLCVASQLVFIVYFVVDSFRKLLDTSSYVHKYVREEITEGSSQIQTSFSGSDPK
jgi:hypothetical protein